MRTLSQRPALKNATVKKLSEKTNLIEAASDQSTEADRIYTASRVTKWFGDVLEKLRACAGSGERCMLCSGSESSDVEHYRPKSAFPLKAMEWNNYLWACTMCNRFKGNRFPPDTESGGRLINPVDEVVWEFFELDQFGGLLPKWVDGDYDPRARSTRDILRLDRQALRESRYSRRKELMQNVNDTLARFEKGELTVDDIRNRRDAWLKAPHQPDVADYYLNGPGKSEEPFAGLFAIIGA